jgi:hypothetical protein
LDLERSLLAEMAVTQWMQASQCVDARTRVTGWVCEKITQNVAQPFLPKGKNNFYRRKE